MDQSIILSFGKELKGESAPRVCGLYKYCDKEISSFLLSCLKKLSYKILLGRDNIFFPLPHLQNDVTIVSCKSKAF